MPSYPHQSAGNRGADVRAIQGFLRHHGTTGLGITGIYDSPTVAAVRAFQTAQGMPVTGMVNGPTWARFLVWLRPGDSGEAVAVLQRQLNEKRRTGADRRRCLRRRDRDRGALVPAPRGPAGQRGRRRHDLAVPDQPFRAAVVRAVAVRLPGRQRTRRLGHGRGDRPDRGGGGHRRARGPRPGRDRRHRPRARRRHRRPREPRARPRCRCAADAARREPVPLGRAPIGRRPTTARRPATSSGRSVPPRPATSSSSTSTTRSSSARG